MAVANYREKHGHYPPAYLLGPDGRPWHSWRVLILPYIEGEELYRQYRFDEPWDGPNNQLLANRMPNTYRFHRSGDPNDPTTNYLAVVGPETLWPGDTPYCGSPSDGESNTILFVENVGAKIHWMEPRDLDFATMSFDLNHSNGISSPYLVPGFVFADDSIHNFKTGVQPETIRAMLTADGQEQLWEADGKWELLFDGRLRELKR